MRGHYWPSASDEEAQGHKKQAGGTALDGTDFGIICLTAANQHEPWRMFEAGALAKHLEYARVIPLYIDLDAPQVSGRFQTSRVESSMGQARGGSWRMRPGRSVAAG